MPLLLIWFYYRILRNIAQSIVRAKTLVFGQGSRKSEEKEPKTRNNIAHDDNKTRLRK